MIPLARDTCRYHRAMRRSLGWLVLLVACGGSPATDPSSSTEPAAGSETEEVTPTEPAPSECPATFDAPGPSCEGERVLQCTYPEGECYCGRPPLCQGVQPPPMPPEWVCVPNRPPCPEAGTPCEGNAECAPWCCGVGVVCVDGTWQSHHFPCPP
ncbi:hypothetical protein DB32_008509 [Sandaracinus amylolyticus]|uniref:Uncharacterized protein n=2 Tax=Sandaracinus amylolyticus TaxID=927083 RepID=A0A0F6YMH2_9BACT|nr:hypothetical protein DB32_008509 [Sandaracinus amylolyticus]